MQDVLLIVILVFVIFLFLGLCLLVLGLYHQRQEIARIERGVETNAMSQLENQGMQRQLTHDFALVLQETTHTKEYLGMSDVKLNQLLDRVSDMNAIMVNAKKRGTFGEYQLYYLLSNYLGAGSDIYVQQYRLANGAIGDAALKMPGENRVLIIDAKFPSDNYLRIVDDPGNKQVQRDFLINVRKHIKDIAKKYISEETVEHAIMFVPSEAIYLYICESCASLIEEAHRQHVLLTSPSTLMGVVMTFVNIVKDFKRSEHLAEIEQALVRMKGDVDKMNERYGKVVHTQKTLEKQLNELGISVSKVGRQIAGYYEGQVNED